MLGNGLIWAALGFAVLAAVAGPASQRRTSGTWVTARPEVLEMARRAVVASAATLTAAMALLWFAFFTRDFSLAYVAGHTSRATQPWYTFSGVWSGMQGSLLLWCWILALFAAAFVTRRRAWSQSFVPWALPVLGVSVAFFCAITAIAESPFARLEVIPPDGRGMNPLLHSPGMIIHPPMLYAGFTGLAVPFSIAVSALITRRTGADWLRAVRRWMLVPWLLLGAGLVLGGAWAYTELGWGGYWGWDPVENAALMPWLAATAFLHSAVVQERRGMLKVWNVFLVTLSFALAVFGTFLTRSGLLSSVHAFAESPIGPWFFVFLSTVLLVGGGLIAFRLPSLRAEHRLDSAVSRESGFLMNNFLFLATTIVVFWGTVLPLLTEAIFGRELAVGPPFFNRVVSPLGAMLLVLAAVVPVVPWRRGNVRIAARRLGLPAAVSAVAAAASLLVTRRPVFAVVVFLATLVAAVAGAEIARAVTVRRRAGRPSAVRTTFSSNPRRYGGYLVHAGIGVMVLGFAGSFFGTQTQTELAEGGSMKAGRYTLVLREVERFRVPDKIVNAAVVDVRLGGRTVKTLSPQLNFHENWDQPQSEIGIRSTPREDLYVILAGTGDGARSAVLRAHVNPLVFWVWAGAAASVAGALVALLAGTARRDTEPAAEAPAGARLEKARA